MKSEKVIGILQKIYASLKDENGMWRKEPVGVVANADTSEKNIDILHLIVDIIIGSDNISDEVKVFISNDYTIKEVNEEINRRIEIKNISSKKKLKPLPYNNTHKKINDTNDELTVILGPNTIKDIIYDRVEDYGQLDKRIEKFILEYGNGNGMRDNLLISIDEDEIGESSYKNNDEFFDILDTIEMYLIQRRAIIQKTINNDRQFVRYFNYLLNSASLSDKEAQRDRERLLKFLNNEDYKTGYIDDEELDTVEEDIDSLVDELSKTANEYEKQDTQEEKEDLVEETSILEKDNEENEEGEYTTDDFEEDDGDISIDLSELLNSQ